MIPFPFGIYMFKVNKRNTRTRCEICSKVIIKTPERRQWRQCSSVSIVNFEQVNAGWVSINALVIVALFESFSLSDKTYKTAKC